MREREARRQESRELLGAEWQPEIRERAGRRRGK
jgi:hypothetical protein